MPQVADAVLAELASWVAQAMPEIADRIPAGAAVDLGRLGVTAGATFAGSRASFGPIGVDMYQARGGRTARSPLAVSAQPVSHLGAGSGAATDSPVLSRLSALSPLLAERLFGALELTVERLNVAGAPDLAAFWNLPKSGHFLSAWGGQQSQTFTAATTLDRLSPGTVDSVASLTQQIASRPLIAELLRVPTNLTEETAIAAAHGSAYLALAVATTTAALGRLNVGALLDRPAAVVGISLGTAIGLLREAPMPAGYSAAQLAKIRAEYLLPRGAAGSVPVSEHRFALLEGDRFPEVVDFGENGLVTVIDGGAVIRTGSADGPVRVVLTVLEGPPPPAEPEWDEVVEVSWRATVGAASVIGPKAPGDQHLLQETPPWPGDYRLRVKARGRDDTEDDEGYELVVWAAPAAPEVVHRRTDRLGYQLRGQPVPARNDRPELAYRWIRGSWLSEAATVTVVTDSTVEQVLRAFGADPAQPQSLRAIDAEQTERQSIDPWVMVLDTGAAVVAVEYNGYRGADEAVLARAAAGRAASMYWNVNGLTRLSFAEQGRLMAAFEPRGEVDIEPVVTAAMSGLDFDDYRDRVGKGLVAVERFTGYAVTSDDLARIQAADIGFRIMPDLP